MTGYLAGANSIVAGRNRTGRPGYTNQARGTGYGFLARDTTALELNDRGWGNLPPWGYSRNGADPLKTGLSGLGCGGACGFAGLAGLGESFGTDEEAEAAGLAVGYLDSVLPRLQALQKQVEAIGPPGMFDGYSSSYYDKFQPVLEETLKILENRPAGLSQEVREALAHAATGVSSAFLRVSNKSNTDSFAAVTSVFTMNYSALLFLLIKNKDSVARITSDVETEVGEVAVDIKNKIDKAIETGKKIAEGTGNALKYMGYGLIAIVGLGILWKVAR